MATTKTKIKNGLKLLFFLMPIAGFISMLFPGIIRRQINKYLKTIEGIEAEIGHVRLSFIRHRLTVKDAIFNKLEGLSEEKSIQVTVKKLQITFSWLALFRGEIISSVLIDTPEARFIKTEDKSEPSELKSAGEQPVQRKPMFNNLPVKITQFDVVNGTVTYTDPYTEPTVNLVMHDMELTGKNLTTIAKRSEKPETTLTMRGLTHGGLAKLSAKAWILEPQPAFDVNFELEGVGLPTLNAFFNNYGKFEAKSGILALYAEAAAKEGRFKGYVKPVVTNLEIASKVDANESLLHVVWDGLLSIASKVLENQQEDQLATKVPFSGKFKSPDVGVWFAIIETLRNAFVSALKPSIDYEINIGSVKRRGDSKS